MSLKRCLLLGLMGASMTAVAENIDYQINGETYQGFYTSAADNAPLVLLIHDWDGLTDYEIKRANMLAEEGYAVFAADLFGKGIRPTEDKDKKQHTGELYQDRQKMRQLIKGALDKAAELGANRQQTVVIGYCFGGAAALEMARAGEDLQGVVSFHGGLKTPPGQDYADSSTEILILHGAADKAISMQEFAELSNQLEAFNVPNEMIAYGGADHAFTVFGIDRYHAEADEKSWHRLLQFLDEKRSE
ncbi:MULTISPECIES: dienelactone hydrolase family protein [unclassified Methylophaga]|jgi:dienelactone hydrolase|uniref:dienelactone hydrolase family protein n=1 Tax=unclassified Methylophaga TaxID=2629249 RepID=UPI000C4EACE2|nr:MULTISPECIES: dienelactone hydrolase family protein [unclassified Methylophaga]MAL50239.1 dienelactone hydrolase [Methylophaga sp.]MBP25541.1 dienelactone hydrolase [Methylophaga sp.]|tara:strand:- start:10022 stop:10759 length:738 start_codon:yes stop_codon:yes gene_type:complete